MGYNELFRKNVTINQTTGEYLHIPTGSDLEDVIHILKEKGILIQTDNFRYAAKILKYEGDNVLPGRYKLTNGMSNSKLIRLLKSGMQEPVKLILTNARTKEQLAGIIAKKIEADSLSILSYLNDSEFLYTYELTAEHAIGLFIPNTYEFYWNTNAKSFLERMKKEYDRFWNENRTRKALQLNLTKGEVSTLASIVEKESNYKPERPRIAGVYLNRLRIGMPLQADPTVVFASGNFELKRITSEYTQLDNPYNTYKFPGLPPGPICMPSANAIDAVLNAESHKYIYFCAKEDFSGRHNFAQTFSEHQQNAYKYRKALNKNQIFN